VERGEGGIEEGVEREGDKGRGQDQNKKSPEEGEKGKIYGELTGWWRRWKWRGGRERGR